MNSPASMPSLSVVILTYNEARHIGRALDAIAGIAERVFVIDSGSTDTTVEIARARGAAVLTHPFVSHAAQMNWALENADIATDWVMRLDADEIIEPDLAAEIARELPRLPPEVCGVNLKRKHIFMNRWVKHGGRYPLVMLRIWRRDAALSEQRWMDEHMYLLRGKAVTFNGGFSDHNLNDLTYFTAKHNAYATKEAVQMIMERGLAPRASEAEVKLSSRNAAWRRYAKESIYQKIPFQLAALGYFLYRYIVQLGFLDGSSGTVYHVLQGFWYRYLVGAKAMEFEAAIAGLDREAAIAELQRLSGVDLRQFAGPPPA